MSSVSPVSAEGIDGRLSRTARSKLAICEACLDLVQEGALQPSADEVAKRAGLSRRSIFNHFGDLAELYDAVVEVGMERCAPLLVEIADQGPVARRIEHFVEVRTEFLEATGMFTRALTAQALIGPAADQAVRVTKDALQHGHAEVERLFARELEGRSQSDRTDVLEAISVALAPLSWETNRRMRGFSVSHARALLERTLTALLRDVGVEV
jgi:TetR/AcrR family transcriptional regulator of autoinduction and epiphytic fitness